MTIEVYNNSISSDFFLHSSALSLRATCTRNKNKAKVSGISEAEVNVMQKSYKNHFAGNIGHGIGANDDSNNSMSQLFSPSRVSAKRRENIIAGKIFADKNMIQMRMS